MRIGASIKTFVVAVVFSSCTKDNRLPILGESAIDPSTGKTTYYQTPEFLFRSQSDRAVTHLDFKNKIQVVDFFFTMCPTICPKMAKHLKLVEKAFQNIDEVAIVSFSIDTKNDTPARLQQYSKSYKINNDRWTFLTGESKAVFELAKDYKVVAFDDGTVKQRNIIHDGTFVLVDAKRRIRGYYDGLSVKDTERLILDIATLLKEPE